MATLTSLLSQPIKPLSELRRAYAEAECAKHGLKYIPPTYFTPLVNDNLDNVIDEEVTPVIAEAVQDQVRVAYGVTEAAPLHIPVYMNALQGLKWKLEHKQLNPPTAMSIHQIILNYIRARITRINDRFGSWTDDDLTVFNVELVYPRTSNANPLISANGAMVPELVFSFSVTDDGETLTAVISDPILYYLAVLHAPKMTVFEDKTLLILGDDLLDVSPNIPFDEFLEYFTVLATVIYISTHLLGHADELGELAIPGSHYSIGTYTNMHQTISGTLSQVYTSERFLNVFNCWSGVFQFSLTAHYAGTKCIFGYVPEPMLMYFGFDYMDDLHFTFNEAETPSSMKPFSGTIELFPTWATDYDPTDCRDRLIAHRNLLCENFDTVDYNKYLEVKRGMFSHAKGGAAIKLNAILRDLKLNVDGCSVRSYGDAPGSWLNYLMTQYRIDYYDSISDTRRNDTGDTPFQYYPWLLAKIRQNWSDRVTVNHVDLRLYRPNRKVDYLLSDVAFDVSGQWEKQAGLHESLFIDVINKVYNELNDDGIFIIKLYELTPLLQSAILKLSTKFLSCTFLKPDNSWEDNAERYLICVGYDSSLNKPPANCLLWQDAMLITEQIDAMARIFSRGFGIKFSKVPTIPISMVTLGDVPIHVKLLLNKFRFSKSLFSLVNSGNLSSYTNTGGDRFIKIGWNSNQLTVNPTLVLQETIIGYYTTGRFLPDVLCYHTGTYMNARGVLEHFIYLEPNTAALFTGQYKPAWFCTSGQSPLPEVDGYKVGDYALTSDSSGLPIAATFNTMYKRLHYIRLDAFLDFTQNGFGDMNYSLRQFFRFGSICKAKYFQEKDAYVAYFGQKYDHAFKFDDLESYRLFKQILEEPNYPRAVLSNEKGFSVKVPASLFYQENWTSMGPRFFEDKTGKEITQKSAGYELRRLLSYDKSTPSTRHQYARRRRGRRA